MRQGRGQLAGELIYVDTGPYREAEQHIWTAFNLPQQAGVSSHVPRQQVMSRASCGQKYYKSP